MRTTGAHFFYLIFIFSILFCWPLFSDETICESIVLDSSQLWFDTLEASIKQPLLVKNVTFDSDVLLQKEEFDYLVSIPKGSYVTIEQIKKACSYLKKKNKFETITLTITQSADGAEVHFDLIGLWTFGKVRFQGSFGNKEMYRQQYVGESGNIFDIQRHTYSVKQVEDALKRDGYCKAHVGDYLDYDHQTKTVNATLILTPGLRFIVDQILFEEQNDSNKISHDGLLKKIDRIFSSKIIRSYYSKTMINKEAQRLKDYLYKKGFLNASIELHESIDYQTQKVALRFIIKFDAKRTFIFFGNHFFSKQQLLDHVLVFGRSLYLLPLSLLAEEIIQAYNKKGFWQVTIESKQEDNRYFFLIREGPRARINHVVLQGIQAFDALSLNKKYFGFFKKGLYFDVDVVKKSIINLINFYKKEGFWDVKVLKQSFTQVPHSELYCLEINIEEGKRRYLSSITIEGFPDLLSIGPFKHNTHKLIPFNVECIQEQKQWLVDYFQKQGYWYADVTSELIEHDELVDLIWHIRIKEQQVTFGKTIIIGDTTFPFSIAMRFMQDKEGAPWNKEELEKSFGHLRNFDIFETIHAYPDAIAEHESEKAVMLKLVEDDPFEVRLRAGFQQISKNLTFRNGTTYKIGGSLCYKNPGNVGDSITVDADVTRFYQNISGSYVRPWNFNRPISLILKGYDNIYVQPVAIGHDKPLYKATQQGFLVGLSRKYSCIDWGCNIGLEFFKTSVVSEQLAHAINFAPTLVDKKVLYFFFEPNLFIDYLDDQLNPTRGFLTVVVCKGRFPWDNRGIKFFKLLAEQSFFIPLTPLVLGLRIRVGHIFNERFARVMPSDRFYLGGENSLRAYSPNMAPPLGCYIDEKEKSHLVPQGGKSMLNGNIEVRFPLFRNFTGAIFQDVGILVEHAISEIKGGKWLGATGFGVRYNTPIGPLRFDIGWKWRKNEIEESWFACFLTLGQAF